MKQKARVRSAVAFLLTLTLMLTGMVTNYAPLVQTVYAAEAQETVSEEADAQQGEVLTENTVDTKAETVAKDVEPETQLKAEAEAVEEAEAETAEVKASEAGEVETAEAKADADAGAAEVKASETGEVKEAEVETAEAKADAAEVETAEAKADADAAEVEESEAGEEVETAEVEEAETGEVEPEESAVRTEDGAQQTTVAEWSYSALPENTETIAATSGSGTLTCAGAIVDSYTSSGLTAKPWVYDVAAASGWVMDVDAANSSDLRFTAELRSSGTGPAQFQLMYCLDGQTGWTPIAGTEITLKSTNKEKVYDGLTLPAELNGSHFKLGVLLMGDASVNAFVKNDETLKIAPTGTSSINHIIITGTADGTSGGGEAGGEEPGGEEEPKPQICAKVTADTAPGEVVSGTKVTLSCKTEGAVITYNTDGSESYKPYTEAITITENTTIYAVADKEGYAQSEKAVFAYTIKEEVPEVTKDAKRMDHLTDGNVVALYYGKDGLALSAEANGTKLKGAAASLSGDVLKVPAAAELTVVADAEGNYSFLSDGKYLTSGATGSKLSFETEASEYSLWKLEKADDNGGFYVVNANAKYGTSPQYMEYYSGFTTYSYKADSDAIYVYNFYLLEEGTPSVPDAPPVEVDDSVTETVAQWAGNADYVKAGVTPESGIAGDKYETNDMLAAENVYIAVVNGKAVKPYTVGGQAAAPVYYMGGAGLGAGTDDYVQFVCSTEGFGKLKMSFRLRATNTASGAYQLAYSKDGVTFTNFKTGSYSYKYQSYVGGESTDVVGSGAVTDGVAKASFAPGNYVDFKFDVPNGASDAEKIYIRMIPDGKHANGTTGAVGNTANFRVDSVKLTGNPVKSEDTCSYVKAVPETSAVAVGTKVELTTETEGADIYYAIGDGDFVKYDDASRPVLTELPLRITAYAAKEGKKDSIHRVFSYTQIQAATVKATPNGGSVMPGTSVKMTCDTEGATILYSEDEGENWTEYKEPVILEKLPVSYRVKAVKDGYKDSSEITISFTERLNEKYSIYFGQLHSHTNYSDGAGSCEEAFQHGTGVKNLDFLAVTDHSNSFDNADSASIADGSMSEEWKEGHELADKYSTDDFVSIYGFEMTWSNGLGHMNTFNTDGFQSRTQKEYSTYSTALQNYYATLKTVPDSINQFNHPGTTFGDFSDFAYYDAEMDDLITIIEVGNGEGAIGSSGYFPSYEYYQRALDKGWHVAPTNNQDNHKGLWGDANTGRSVVLADSLTRENIYDAMRNYRMYATEDNDLNIYYTLDGYITGSILADGQTGDTVDLKVELSDKTDAAIGKVQVVTNGGLVLAEKNVASNEDTVTFTVDNNYSYYYIKVVEADGDIAVTAPVWVGKVEAAGINSISTDEVLPVKGEPLKIDLEMYNNEAAAMQIESIEFMVDDEVIHTADLAAAGFSSVEALGTASYSFDFIYDKVGAVTVNAVVKAVLNGAQKVYKSPLKLNYVSPEMVTKVVIDGTHYNDYVTGYYGGNMGNFTAIAGKKNIKVDVVTDEITPEVLKDCALLVISAPAKKSGTANAGDYKPSHFSEEFINTVKEYTDRGGTLIACGIADYQDSTEVQTATEMNKLLAAIGATTKVNSDEAYDEVNNGGQQYRLYLKGTYNAASRYLAGASAEQEYSAYSGCTVALDEAAVAAGKAEALVSGYDTTYSIDCKDENGKSVSGNPPYIEKGSMVAIAHETLPSGANVFVSGTVFISDFEVKAELDNIFDLPYLNRTIAENILDEVTVQLPVRTIADVRKNAQMGDIVSVEGYVTAGTSVEGNTFFDAICIQDDTAGITVFPYSEAGLEIGTKIRILGYVDAYQGEKEVQVMKAEVLKDAEPHIYAPEQMSAADAMDYDKSGGKLVQVEGKVTDVLYDSTGSGVAQMWLDDGSGVHANIFIDGYILSAKTGKNELASIVKKGAVVSAAGLVYAHPEGESDVPVICLRVRNCDEITLVKEAEDSDDGNGGDDNNGDNNNGDNNGGNGADTGSDSDNNNNNNNNNNSNDNDSSSGDNNESVSDDKNDNTADDADDGNDKDADDGDDKNVDDGDDKNVNDGDDKNDNDSDDKNVNDTDSKDDGSKDKTSTPSTNITANVITYTVNGVNSWQPVKDALTGAKLGEIVKASLKGTNVLPKDVLACMKGRDVTLVLEMENGICWSINGKSIKSDVLMDIDFGVVLNSKAIPEELVKKTAAGKTYLEISLNHDGAFGFEAILYIQTGKQNANKFAKLYYYNEAKGKMEFVTSAKIDGNGNAALLFTHASNYIIVIDEVPAVRTGDDAPLAQAMLLLLLGMAVLALAVQKKRFRVEK